MPIRAIVAAAVFLAGGACAQTPYPQKPVQVIVGFSAGGSVDVMARTLINAISAQLGQPFVIVNRDGASGSIGSTVRRRSECASSRFDLLCAPCRPEIWRNVNYEDMFSKVPAWSGLQGSWCIGSDAF